jgi:hypothetical protein
MFRQDQSAALPIDDPKATPSPQAATSSSSDAQQIQNQSGDGKAKDHVIIVQDQVLPVQNQQKYPAMRDQDGRLTGWSLPHNHFEKDVSNFFEHVPEEVP